MKFSFSHRADSSASETGRKRERGIALLIVMTMLVMFTAFVADFVYSSRVKYTMASHTRDAARAHALAVSGIRIYQLLLTWGDTAQRQLEKSPFKDMIPGIGGSGSMVVQLIPILDTGMLRMLGGGGFSMGEEEGEEDAPRRPGETDLTALDDAPQAASGSFLDFEGDFMVSVTEESTKISLNGMAKPNSGLNSSAAQLLLQTLKREQYEPIFREMNLMPEELVSNIIDWGDFNGERANGQGYEDNLYNRLPEPYNVKNSPFDSVSELHLVAGMTDELYGIVAPLVTAHHVEDTISLPLTGQDMLAALLRAAVPAHRWTEEDIASVWEQYMMNAVLMPPTNADTLVAVLKLSSQTLSSLTADTIKPFITEGKKRPKVFRLVSTGSVGEVERTIEAVIDIGKNHRLGGLIVYWREE